MFKEANLVYSLSKYLLIIKPLIQAASGPGRTESFSTVSLIWDRLLDQGPSVIFSFLFPPKSHSSQSDSIWLLIGTLEAVARSYSQKILNVGWNPSFVSWCLWISFCLIVRAETVWEKTRSQQIFLEESIPEYTGPSVLLQGQKTWGEEWLRQKAE